MDIQNAISAELSALLNRNPGFLQGQSYTGNLLGLAGHESLGFSTNSDISSLLASLILQQQAEERQKVLLIQQLALLCADSNGPSPFAIPSQANTLALMLQQRQQQSIPVENTSFDQLSALRQLMDLTDILQAQQRQEQQHQQDAANILYAAESAQVKRKGRSGSRRRSRDSIVPPHGKAFAIHKPRDFVKTIMPRLGRLSRLSSFQRQLNLYDFQRITEGQEKGAYYHELFVRDKPILASMMKRNKIKGVKHCEDVSHDDEEDDDDEKRS